MKKIFSIILISVLTQGLISKEVNVYTSRHYDSDDALYQEFTNETGIEVNIISGKGLSLIHI